MARQKGRSKGSKMNAIKIEQAVSAFAKSSFDAVEFPFAFLHTFDNKEPAGLQRLMALSVPTEGCAC